MKFHKPLLCLWVIIFCVTGCTNNSTDKIFPGNDSIINHIDERLVPKTPIQPPPLIRWTVKDFYSNNSLLSEKVDSLFNALNVNERAAQLIMPGTGISKSFGLPFATIMQLYKSRIIGGVLFLKGTRQLFAGEVKKLNQSSIINKILPPLFSCDCEPTLFHRKFTDADSMIAASGLLTLQDVKMSAANISHEMKQLGIQWNFAPVADVDFNKDIINNRSFGSDTQQVIQKSMVFISSSADSNIATTIKHFPGHGGVVGDSHHNLVYIDSIMSETENFRSIISAANPISVMIGHIAVKNNSLYNTNDLPSSLSGNIINGLLRNKFGFKGIVVTDAMNMGAVKNIPGADHLAILSGNDIVVMPQNVRLLHKLLVSDLLKNGILKKRLEVSIKKVLKLKICLGLI